MWYRERGVWRNKPQLFYSSAIPGVVSGIRPNAFPVPDPPTIHGIESFHAFTTGADPQVLSLSSQTYSAGDYGLFFFGTDGGATIGNLTSATDDTYAQIVSHTGSGGAPTSLKLLELTVVGAGLDASVSVDLSSGRDACGGLITISGADVNANQPAAVSTVNLAPSENRQPVSSGITLPEPNCLVFSIWHSYGGQTVGNINAGVPADFTMLGALVSGATETSTAQSSMGIAYRVYDEEDFDLDDETGNITWGATTLDANVDWSAFTIAIRPAPL